MDSASVLAKKYICTQALRQAIMSSSSRYMMVLPIILVYIMHTPIVVFSNRMTRLVVFKHRSSLFTNTVITLPSHTTLITVSTSLPIQTIVAFVNNNCMGVVWALLFGGGAGNSHWNNSPLAAHLTSEAGKTPPQLTRCELTHVW
jgi:hypothetical protein